MKYVILAEKSFIKLVLRSLRVTSERVKIIDLRCRPLKL